jgi:hypothetical protein
MIKRIAIWLLIVVYLPQTMGVRMAIHFCAGDFERIVFFDDSESYCDCGVGISKSGKPHKSCCKDVHVRCELKSKQIPSVNLYWSALILQDCDYSLTSQFQVFSLSELISAPSFKVHDPPPLSGPKVFIRNQVFRL